MAYIVFLDGVNSFHRQFFICHSLLCKMDRYFDWDSDYKRPSLSEQLQTGQHSPISLSSSCLLSI